MATIVVFASSLFIVLVLILFKAIELKYGKKNMVLGLINCLDTDLHKIVVFFKFKSLQLIQSIRYIILVEIKRIASDLFYKAHGKISSEYKIRQNSIMGRKNIASKGSVSFYLKKITEHKGNREKGKIEDNL